MASTNPTFNNQKLTAAKPPAPTYDGLAGKIDNPWRKPLRRFMRNKLAIVGLVVFLILVLLALFAPVIASKGPDAIDLRNSNQGPTLEHWLGTDGVGRDTFARTIYGGQASIMVGLISVAISLAFGATLGAIAGFFGGFWDGVIMRATDVFMAFPPIILILTVAAIAGPGLLNTILLIGFLNWPIPCRLMRAKFLSLREQEFITASRAVGARNPRLILKHMLPNALDVLIVYASLGVANAILLEAGLSFLGLGVQLPTPSWGNILNTAQNISILESQPWQWMPAGGAIILMVLAVNFIGDGLRDALDPRMRI
jgi:peptide/nickel transport system permease protein